MKYPKVQKLFIAILAWGIVSGIHAEAVSVYKTKTGTGWLEKTSQGDRILHLEGSYYDMGYEQAKLLGKDTEVAVRSAKNAIHRQFPYLPFSLVVYALDKFIYEKQAPYIPQEFKDEMQGLADGSGVSIKIIRAAHAQSYLTSCVSAAAWGSASKDGALYFLRSNDSFTTFDPETKTVYHDLGMVVIYKPQGGQPYMMFSWPGFVGASDGMNAAGIVISNMSNPSRYETAAGIPMNFRIKQALAKAGNLDQAVKWITAKPYEGGYNFLVADGKIPSAVAIEMDARTVYVGGWDGPAESNHYIYKGREYSYQPKKDLLTRTNHPLSSELITEHKGDIDDKNLDNRFSGRRYPELRARLVNNYGSLDLEKMNEIMREHYRSIEYSDDPTPGATTHQFAYAPKTGDFIVAVSKGNPVKIGREKASAFNQPWRKYNFFKLLDEKPE